MRAGGDEGRDSAAECVEEAKFELTPLLALEAGKIDAVEQPRPRRREVASMR